MLARAPGGTRVAFVWSLALVAVVTAILNLDTSVVFLTPVLLHLARVRGVDERPFLYGTVFMSNAASLFLPGSNLTNLITLHGEHASGAAFLSRMWAAASVAVVVTVVVLLAAFRRELGLAATRVDERAPARFGVGIVAVALSTVLVLTPSAPALPVLAVGVAAVLVDRVGAARIHEIVDARVLAGLFVVAVALGAVGRWWDGPAALLGYLGRSATRSAVRSRRSASTTCRPRCCSPARARARARAPDRPEPRPEPRGHRLAVRLLWLRVARSLGARPSVRTYSSSASCSCRCRSPRRSARSGSSRRAGSERGSSRLRASGSGR